VQRMARVALVLAIGVGAAGCQLIPGANAITYEVSAVAPGEAAGNVLVTVAEYGAGGPNLRQWTLDDRGQIAPGQRPSPPAPPQVEDCAGMDCYRVVTGQLQVQESHDSGATYTTVWQVAGHTRRELASAYDGLGDPAIHLSSRAVVVHATAGGHVVFVADGRDGVLYRNVDGTWHRLGIPMGGEGVYFQRPPRLDTDPSGMDPGPLVAAVMVLLVLLVGGVTAGVRRTLPLWRAVVVLVIAAAAGVIAGFAAGFPDVGMFPGYVSGGMIILATLLCAAGLAVVVAAAARKPSTRPRERTGTGTWGSGHN